MKKVMAVLAVLATGGVMAAPAAAATTCVSDHEAESLTLVAMPELLSQLGTTCTPRLPADALLRHLGSALPRYRAAADRAWPSARAGLAKVLDPSVAPMLQSDFARPMLAALVVPQLVGQVDPAACPSLNRLVSLLQPLPPTSLAAAFVVTLGLLERQKRRGDTTLSGLPALPLCTAEGR